MIQFLCGLPGKGKGVLATRQAVKYHKSRRARRMLKAVNAALPLDNQLKSLVFSNYPILVDSKKKVYSNYISFMNLTTEREPGKGFFIVPGAYIVIDEAQKYYDSREFKRFPKQIGTFLQHHRHGSIERIVIISQDPTRVDVKVRNLSESYTQIVRS